MSEKQTYYRDIGNDALSDEQIYSTLYDSEKDIWLLPIPADEIPEVREIREYALKLDAWNDQLQAKLAAIKQKADECFESDGCIAIEPIRARNGVTIHAIDTPKLTDLRETIYSDDCGKEHKP